MRHRGWRRAFAVGTLPSAMGLAARSGGLITAARRSHLDTTHALAAVVAAIPLSTVTTTADGKHRVAGWGLNA